MHDASHVFRLDSEYQEIAMQLFSFEQLELKGLLVGLSMTWCWIVEWAIALLNSLAETNRNNGTQNPSPSYIVSPLRASQRKPSAS